MNSLTHKLPRRILHTSDVHILVINSYTSRGFQVVDDLDEKTGVQAKCVQL